MGTDDPSKLGLAEKSKDLASPLAEFLLLYCPIRATNVSVGLVSVLIGVIRG